MVIFNIDYGYVSVIFLFINIICYIIKQKAFKYCVRYIVCTLIVILLSSTLLDSNNPNVDYFIPNRSYCEIAIFLYLTISFLPLLLKEHNIPILILSIVSIPLQFHSLMYIVSYEFIGISTFVIAFLKMKKTSRVSFTLLYILGSFLILTFIYNFNWENKISDFRKNKVIHIKTEGAISYYELRNVEDNEERTKMIFDNVNYEKNGTYVFLEDKAAAYSFKRTSIRMPSLFDNNNLTFDEKQINSLILKIQDGFIVNDFVYDSNHINSFEIQGNKNDTIFVKILNSDLTLKTINNMLHYLKLQDISTPQKIILTNAKEEKKLFALIDNNKYFLKFY